MGLEQKHLDYLRKKDIERRVAAYKRGLRKAAQHYREYLTLHYDKVIQTEQRLHSYSQELRYRDQLNGAD